MSKKDEALKMAQDLRALADRFSEGWHDGIKIDASDIVLLSDAAEALAEQPAQQQEPIAWVYPEGLEALKAGKPWTAYGRRQEPNNTALYLSPQPDIPPYAWVTFTPYGDEDDVWYENPEGKLLEGWTYKPLYDTTPPKRTWVGLTDEEWQEIDASLNGKRDLARIFVRAIEAKLREKNAQPSKPLTNAQIGAVAAEIWGSVLIAPQSYQAFARAIEAAHGIGENK